MQPVTWCPSLSSDVWANHCYDYLLRLLFKVLHWYFYLLNFFLRCQKLVFFSLLCGHGQSAVRGTCRKWGTQAARSHQMKTCALRACHCRHYPSTSGKRPRLASTMTSAEGRCHVIKGCRGKTAWRGWSQTSLSLTHTPCLHVICDCLHCNTSRGSERELMSCLAGKPVKTLISNRVRNSQPGCSCHSLRMVSRDFYCFARVVIDNCRVPQPEKYIQCVIQYKQYLVITSRGNYLHERYQLWLHGQLLIHLLIKLNE